MKPIILFVGGLAAMFILSLSSCGDKQAAAENDPAKDPPAAAGAYPLKTCVVSGEELGSMGKPHVITHEGTEVRLCCKDCLKDFNADPGKYVALVKAGPADPLDHSKHDH